MAASSPSCPISRWPGALDWAGDSRLPTSLCDSDVGYADFLGNGQNWVLPYLLVGIFPCEFDLLIHSDFSPLQTRHSWCSGVDRDHRIHVIPAGPSRRTRLRSRSPVPPHPNGCVGGIAWQQLQDVGRTRQLLDCQFAVESRTTVCLSRASGVRFTPTRSPSRIPSSIIESP